MSTQIYEDDAFYALFEGKEDIAPTGETYKLAAAWLLSDKNPLIAVRKAEACIAFMEKPKKFLILGYTNKSGLGDGKGVNDKLYDYLPLHDPSFLESLKTGEAKDRNAYQSRMAFPGRAQLINYTMVKNVGLMVLESVHDKGFTFGKLIPQWFGKYGDKPTGVEFSLDMAKGNPRSFEIKKDVFDKFRYNKNYWMLLVEQLTDVFGRVDKALKERKSSSSSSETSQVPPSAPSKSKAK